jgi:DNA (cytosine-5)-methyltransferase 1
MGNAMNPWAAVSLFSGAGIGDVGLRAAGIDFLALAELDEPRAEIARANFPEAAVFVVDLEQEWSTVCSYVEQRLAERSLSLDLITCTPPCQGMSKSGQGTLLRNIREGKRPNLDPRNRLILAGLDVIKRLQPRWVIFENVIEMQHTVIADRNGHVRPILDIVADELDGYIGFSHAVEFADHGVPQRRQRLITVLSSDIAVVDAAKALDGFVPAPTHSSSARNGLTKWVAVDDALKAFPALDARSADAASSQEIPFHRVPVLDARKYFWLANTPPGGSAFDNQCVNATCGFDGNPTHGAARTNGVNQSRKDTPVTCLRCGERLPRPTTVLEDGSERLMSGYTSAYKRMRGDLPAPAVTRNLSYPCSDHKVHPSQNRVLSLAEAFVIQTLADYRFRWERKRDDGSCVAARDGLIRLVLGESVPPRFLERLGQFLRAVECGDRPRAATGRRLPTTSLPPHEQLVLAEPSAPRTAVSRNSGAHASDTAARHAA